MSLMEGQVFEGEVGSFGAEAPLQQWIVVSPFGKTCLHSITDSLEHRFMALATAQNAIEQGRLRYRSFDQDHPVVHLQRRKEQRDVRDTHMSADKLAVARMMALLDEAIKEGQDYAPFLAGEVLAMLERARYRYGDTAPLVEQVHSLFATMPAAMAVSPSASNISPVA